MKIPVVEPGNLQLRTTSPNAPMRKIGTSGQALQAAGGTIKKIADERYRVLDAARNYTEASQAELFTTSKMADLLLKADTDTYTDPEGKVRLKTGKKEDFAYYDEQIRKGRQEVTKFFSNKEQQEKFLAEYDKSAIIARNQIQRRFTSNMIAEGRVAVFERIDELANAFAVSDDPKKGKIIPRLIEAEIDKAVAMGFFKLEKAHDLKKKVLEDAKETGIRGAIATNAIDAKDALLKGDYQLSADETAKWVEVADKKIKRNKKIEDDARDQMWLNNGAAIIENLEATSTEDIIRAIAQENINPDFGNDLIKWKTDPEAVQYETDKKIWLEIARDSIRPEQDLRDFQRSLARGVADKKIQATEAAELSVQVKALFDGAIKFKSRPSRFNQLIGATMDMFKNWADVTASPLIATFNMTKELIKGIKDETITRDNIEEKSQDILEDTKKMTNPNRAQFKIDDIVNTPAGPRKIVGFDVDGEPLVRRVK